jgi:hypothetical protein
MSLTYWEASFPRACCPSGYPSFARRNPLHRWFCTRLLAI